MSAAETKPDEIEGDAEEIRPDPTDATPEEIAAFTPDPEEYVPTGTEIDVFRRMELEDERAVMEELQGRALDVMLYEYEQGGKKVIGFGVTGVMEAVNTLNRRGFTRIRISPAHEPRFVECEVEGKPAVRCVVYAEDLAHGSGQWGTAEQPKKFRKRGGGEAPDPFVFRKALAKAQRNALERLVPLELREYLKAQYQGAGKVKVIPGAEQATPDRPPALTDEKAQEQLKRMRALYDEIKAIDRLVMPPGQFNALVMAAQHDHDRMAETIAHLEAFRDTEEEIRSLSQRLGQAIGAEALEEFERKLVGMNQQARKNKFTTAIEEAS